MKKNGNWFKVTDSKGFELEIGDWTRLTHHEYFGGGQRFQVGQPARITDVIMDNRGIQVEVEIHQTKILVPPNRLLFYQRPGATIGRAVTTKNGQPVCPKCSGALSYWNGADDFCERCGKAARYMLPAKGVKLGG